MNMSENQRAKLRAIRAAMDGGVTLAATQGAAEINTVVEMIRPWKVGAYAVGDVRAYASVPYKCVQAHDSTENTSWTPDATPALWMQYHGTSKETARAWVAPTGAQDIYKQGEWMIYTDGKYYECLTDTNFSPTDLASAWKADEEDAGGSTETDEWPEFVQPSGSHDAYKTGDKITFNGKHYICKMDGCAYSPTDYPGGWTEQA